MKKYAFPIIIFSVIISFILFFIIWFFAIPNFNKQVSKLKSNLYFVPLNPEKATNEDWIFLNEKSWIYISSIDVSNFSFVYWNFLVNDDDPNNLYFYLNKNTSEIQSEYSDQLKDSILQLAVYFTSLKYLTYTEEFADIIIKENEKKVLGSSGTHYYFSPYMIYSQDNVQKTTASNTKQAKVNPLEFLIEYRNINYDLHIGYKLPEWIYQDYHKKGSANYTKEEFSSFSKNNFKNYNKQYEDVLGIGSSPSESPMITVKWDEQTFNNPDLLVNDAIYDGYVMQRSNLFGDSNFLNNDDVPVNNGVKFTPKYLKSAETMMHEVGHNLGYEHTNSVEYYDAVYWAGEAYQYVYNLTFRSEKYNKNMTVSDWFMNEINMNGSYEWEHYNLYDYLWDFENNSLGDILLTNNYYNPS
ncbi:MAG: hypothetical protein HPAVJP_1170 [Candidatus Hepatoplasma vulgare]|nr:MAG: hypothetical protein HPAVJP_1170 [Candidatus Hepatoplasma sp.]